MTDEMIFASPECGEIFTALSAFQAKCEAPKREKPVKVKGTTQSGEKFEYSFKYAPLEEIHRVIKEPMAENGLGHRQFLALRDAQWVMRTIITHKSGQWMGCDYPVIAEKKGAQGFASGTTFARRYGLTLALGIAAEDDDDANLADGNSATFGEPRQAPRAGMVRAADVPRESEQDQRQRLMAQNTVPMPPQKANGKPVEHPNRQEALDAFNGLKASIAEAPTPKAIDDIIKHNSAQLELIKEVHNDSFVLLLSMASRRRTDLLASA